MIRGRLLTKAMMKYIYIIVTIKAVQHLTYFLNTYQLWASPCLLSCLSLATFSEVRVLELIKGMVNIQVVSDNALFTNPLELKC